MRIVGLSLPPTNSVVLVEVDGYAALRHHAADVLSAALPPGHALRFSYAAPAVGPDAPAAGVVVDGEEAFEGFLEAWEGGVAERWRESLRGMPIPTLTVEWIPEPTPTPPPPSKSAPPPPTPSKEVVTNGGDIDGIGDSPAAMMYAENKRSAMALMASLRDVIDSSVERTNFYGLPRLRIASRCGEFSTTVLFDPYRPPTIEQLRESVAEACSRSNFFSRSEGVEWTMYYPEPSGLMVDIEDDDDVAMVTEKLRTNPSGTVLLVESVHPGTRSSLTLPNVAQYEHYVDKKSPLRVNRAHTPSRPTSSASGTLFDL